jgi:methylamine dehydrogenase accessory protein MauD
MNTLLLISTVVLWLLVLFLGFLLLGTLRALGLLSWRLEQLEATTPSRLGRDGLKIGKKAPDFSLPSATGSDVALHDFAGCRVLLVFTQSGCGPCHDIVPELNRIQRKDEVCVVAVNNGGLEAARKLIQETKASFPVLAQEQFSLSKRYQVFATPFALLIDEKGIITSKGVCGSRQHLGYVLDGAGKKAAHVESEVEGQVESRLAG